MTSDVTTLCHGSTRDETCPAVMVWQTGGETRHAGLPGEPWPWWQYQWQYWPPYYCHIHLASLPEATAPHTQTCQCNKCPNNIPEWMAVGTLFQHIKCQIIKLSSIDKFWWTNKGYVAGGGICLKLFFHPDESRLLASGLSSDPIFCFEKTLWQGLFGCKRLMCAAVRR